MTTFFDKAIKSRSPANARVDKFKEFQELAEGFMSDDNSMSDEVKEKYNELAKEVSNALYWMQRQVTQAEEWLEEEDGKMFGNRDQRIVDRLRNVRDALPYDMARWSGEKN